MKKIRWGIFGMLMLSLVLTYGFQERECRDCGEKSCTAFAAGKLATVDGSTMSGHTCDGGCDFTLRVVPPRHFKSGETVRIDYAGLPGGISHIVRGETPIPQVAETYAYFQIECPIGNEHQVFFGENTCGTRRELRVLSSEDALIDYTLVAALALQRGRTAREAIRIAGALIEEYGLNGSGESFLVSDPDEAWCFEIPGFTKEWVAQRIPDDHVCPHANRMRIGEIDLNNPEFFMASKTLVKTAREKGFYDPVEDGPFHFAKVYSGNNSIGNRRREWRMFSMLCPSREWDPDGAVFPFSVKPDERISARWWIDNVWRDHMEGTPYDKTKGAAAGPFGCPDRPRISGLESERSICVGGSGYTWVSQARSWLPDSIGGVVWFGVDCPRSTCYVPFYAGISDTPKSWRSGDFTRFSPDSARWYFQAIDTLSWLRYNEVHADVREAFGPIEEKMFRMQPGIEKQALEMHGIEPLLAKDFLTKYSADCALNAENAARELFYMLLAKYADGRPRTEVSGAWLEILNKKP